MIDICTVVHDEEIPLLILQAQSLQRYASTLGTRNIYVIVNDQDQCMNKIDPRWWGSLASQVCVIPRSFWSATWNSNGWLSQQLWKLLAAAASWNTWTMVLDAKTILVRELTLDQILDDRARACVGLCPIQPVFDASRRICEQLWNQDIEQQLGPAGVPFLFHNDTVRAMITEITRRTGQPFPVWFQEQGLVTEFILYSSWVQQSRPGQLYSAHCAIHPVNLCHSEVALFDQKIQAMRAAQTTTVSIHRRAWPQLTPDQRQQYRDLLVDRNIISGAFIP